MNLITEKEDLVRIIEIKKSINGEINKWHQGSPAIFIRFAGCNLWDPDGKKSPCLFCDTRHALNPTSGFEISYHSILEILNGEDRNQVIVFTGGEPLYHMVHVLPLLNLLYKRNFNKIVIETNGTISPKEVVEKYPKVNIVMDYKLKSSGNEHLMQVENFSCLRSTDVVKFPVKDLKDLEMAVKAKAEIQEYANPLMAVSPIFRKEGVTWDSDNLIRVSRDMGFTISVQIHKILKCY